MSEEYVNLLEYIKSECERDYKLFSIADTVEILNRAYFNYQPISEDKFRLMIRELYDGEYVELKYLDEEVALIKPLARGFTVKKEIVDKNPPAEIAVYNGERRDWVFFLFSFVCSFIGALLGGLIC